MQILRDKIFEEISGIEDEEYLKGLYQLILESRKPDIQLSLDQIRLIRKSQKQIEAGEFYTQQQMNQLYSQWQGRY